VHPYLRSESSWLPQPKIAALYTADLDEFGHSVSIHQDRVIIGAPSDDDLGFQSGSAAIYRHENNQWVLEQRLFADDTTREDRFGRSVAISGDYAVVGAPNKS